MILAMLAMCLAAAAADEPPEMHEILLDEPDERVEIQFRLDAPGTVEFRAYFPPAELGDLRYSVLDASGSEAEYGGPTVLPAGAYRGVVSAPGTSATPFLLRIVALDPLDPFEPNDTPETATPVAPPWSRTVLLHYDLHDMFRVRAGRAGVLSVRVTPADPNAIPHFSVTDGSGHVLYHTQEWYDHRGARYMPVGPGEVLLDVWESMRAVTAARIDIVLYVPEPGRERSGHLVALGIPDGSSDLRQLEMIARGSGGPLIRVLTAEEVRRELTEAARRPARRAAGAGSLWPLAVGFLLAVGVVAAFWLRVRAGWLRSR